MNKKLMKDMNFANFDDLFGPEDGGMPIDGGRSDVVEIPLRDLHDFPNHPFKVRSDAELQEMVASIKDHGVLVPGIARERPDGTYDIIAGHTRKRASELAGKQSMPMVVMDLDDDTAAMLMVDTNIQRENIMVSEKARAYRIKYDAIKNQGKAGNSLNLIGEKSGESGKTVQRLIRLSYLKDGLLKLVDDRKLGIRQGVSISYLKENEQEELLDIILDKKLAVSIPQADQIKELSQSGGFSREAVSGILQAEGAQPKSKGLVIKSKDLKGYFPENYTEEDMRAVIYQLLEDWKGRNVG